MRDSGAARLPSLDGMRAIAIVLVVLSHVWLVDGLPDHWLQWIPHAYGDAGVRIFFVISGFIITTLLLREWNANKDILIRSFYVRRAVRILPVYISFLAVLAAFQFIGAANDQLSSWVGALTFTRNMIGRGNDLTPHLWSLSVEEQFYIAWPFALLLGLRSGLSPRKWLSIVVAAIVLAVLVRMIPPPGSGAMARLIGEKSIFRYLDGIAIGCAAAFVLPRFREWPLHPTVVLWSGCIVVVATVIAESWVAHQGGAILRTVEAIGVAMAILGGSQSQQSIIFRGLNCRVVRYVGTLSYSIYIWHPLFLNDTFFPALGIKFPFHETVFRLMFIPVVLASYHLIEVPASRSKTRELFRRPTVQGSQSHLA